MIARASFQNIVEGGGGGGKFKNKGILWCAYCQTNLIPWDGKTLAMWVVEYRGGATGDKTSLSVLNHRLFKET